MGIDKIKGNIKNPWVTAGRMAFSDLERNESKQQHARKKLEELNKVKKEQLKNEKKNLSFLGELERKLPEMNGNEGVEFRKLKKKAEKKLNS